MPRFKFNLQRVLEIRKHKEELLKNQLSALSREYIHEDSLLSELKTRHRLYLDKMRTRQGMSILIEEMLWYYSYLEHLDNCIKRQKMKLLELLQRIEETRAKVIKASKDRRILERLREKRLMEFKREEERRDGAFLDEIAISMYVRKANQLSYR